MVDTANRFLSAARLLQILRRISDAKKDLGNVGNAHPTVFMVDTANRFLSAIASS